MQQSERSSKGHHRSEGSVTRKRGLWYAVLSLGRDDGGKRIRQWSTGFKARREAERALAQLLLEGRVTKRRSTTVHELLSSYIEADVTARGRRSPTTTQRYRGLARNAGTIANKQVDRLSCGDIETFYLFLMRLGLSHTTVHHVHNLLCAACRWGKTARIALITRNPFETGAIERPRRARSRAQALTIEQARRAIEYLAETKHANALAFALATACRRGETCGLKWNAIDLERKVAIIRESRYQANRTQGQKATKEEHIREVPLNDTACASLIRESERQKARRLNAGDAWIESGFVFTDELGQPLSPMALTNAFGRCARRAGLPTTRMHDLRHTAATFMLSAGGSPVAASKILGHSEETTTMRLYGHVIGLDAVRAARAYRSRPGCASDQPTLSGLRALHYKLKLSHSFNPLKRRLFSYKLFLCCKGRQRNTVNTWRCDHRFCGHKRTGRATKSPDPI